MAILTPIKLLEKVYPELEKCSCQFALAGGLAASFYRKQIRTTTDLDILFSDGNLESSREKARMIIKSLGFKTSLGWIYTAEKSNMDQAAMIIGQTKESNTGLQTSIDFLLPAFPWAAAALERASSNLIDFEFAKIPCMTAEDIIIAKCFALTIEESRFQDLDDLKHILNAGHTLDKTYLRKSLENQEISLPKQLEKAFKS